MAELTLKKVYGALKRGRLHPVYYLTGSEDILKDELISALANAAVDPASRDFNLDTRSAADLDGESLNALVETPPMLADRRVVIVRGLEQWRKNAKVWKVLWRYLEQPSPSTVLILTHRTDEPERRIAAAATHVRVDALEPALAHRWLMKRAGDADVDLQPEAAEHLADAVGGDLALLSQEIEKLAAASTGRPVTVDDVAAFVGVRRGETTHDWVDAVLARDGRRAAHLVDVVLGRAGVTGVQLVMALGTALIGTRAARAQLDDGTPQARLERAVLQRLKAARPRTRLRGYEIEAKAWAAAAGKWSTGELDRFIACTYAADRQLKSTSITDAGGVLQALSVHAAPRAAA